MKKAVPLLMGTAFYLPFFTILTICLKVIVDDILGHTRYSLYHYYSFFRSVACVAGYPLNQYKEYVTYATSVVRRTI